MNISKIILGIFVLLVSSPLWAMDQCNTTNQCKVTYGSKATDCKNSRTNNSICMCGSGRCDAKASKVLYKDTFDSKKSPWNQGGVQYGNYGKGGKGVRIKYTLLQGKDSAGNNVRGTKKLIGGGKSFTRTKSATLLYDIKFANDWNTSAGGKFNGLGPKNHVTGCKRVTNDRWSARVRFKERVPSLYLYYYGKKAKCGESINQVNKKLNKNKWYRVAMYIKINDKNRNNAIARLYIDGQKVGEKKNFKFHNSSSKDVDIQKFMLSTFLVRSMPKGKFLESQTAHFDNVRVLKGEVKK